MDATVFEFPKADETKHKRTREMQDLFDAVNRELNLREGHIFRSFYANWDEGREALGAFLRDVALCPPEVEEYYRQLLIQNRRKRNHTVVKLRA
jgi:hypothetical protein